MTQANENDAHENDVHNKLLNRVKCQPSKDYRPTRGQNGADAALDKDSTKRQGVRPFVLTLGANRRSSTHSRFLGWCQQNTPIKTSVSSEKWRYYAGVADETSHGRNGLPVGQLKQVSGVGVARNDPRVSTENLRRVMVNICGKCSNGWRFIAYGGYS